MRMCRCAVASRRFARTRPATRARAAPPASRTDGASHGASTETSRGGVDRRAADDQEENLRTAELTRALPPLFAFVLHERDLRSFERAAPLYLSVACAFTMPVSTSDRGVRCRPKWFVNDNLALCSQPSWKNILLAHNCDRQRRGWFSSQISDFLRRRRTRNTCAATGRHSS